MDGRNIWTVGMDRWMVSYFKIVFFFFSVLEDFWWKNAVKREEESGNAIGKDRLKGSQVQEMMLKGV